MSARWKYKTETVTVDENTVTVRGLTAGERLQFSEASKTAKAARDAGQASDMSVPHMVAKMGITSPADLTDEDLRAMPGDLMDAAVTKILRLSGVETAKEGEEKKGEAGPG